MNGTLRLRFEWPSLTADALACVLGDRVGISKSDDGLFWSLALGADGAAPISTGQCCRK